MRSTRWNTMQICMEIQFHGAPLPIANICFFLKNKIILVLFAFNVKNSIVWIADVIGINRWVANNIKLLTHIVHLMMHLWSLWLAKNSSNAQNASFGYRKMKDAIIWHVNVNSNFAINVEVSIWNANVCRKWRRTWKEEGSKHNKEEERNYKRKRKLHLHHHLNLGQEEKDD